MTVGTVIRIVSLPFMGLLWVLCVLWTAGALLPSIIVVTAVCYVRRVRYEGPLMPRAASAPLRWLGALQRRMEGIR